MIRKTVHLRCTPARAFELFTGRAGAWWPPGLRHTDDPQSEIRLLPTGRFFERAADGLEVELGRVAAWEPPALVVLDFFPGTDSAHPTVVTIRFAADAGGTLVVVEHGPGPRSGALWAAGAPRFAQAWTLVLAALRRESEPLP